VLDAAGAQLLMLCKREALARGHRLELVGHSEPVVRLFELLDLTAYFGDPVLLAAAGRDAA
jgi:anti-anti-sigma regulatory factor